MLPNNKIFKRSQKESGRSAHSGVFAGLILVISLLVLPLEGFAADIFEKLATMPQVESTYISGRMANRYKTWTSSSGRRRMDLSQGFSAMYAYECYSKEACAEARKILDNYLKKHPEVTLMVRTKELSGNYELYQEWTKDNKLKKMIMWTSDGPSVCDIVVIDWNKGLDGNKIYKD